MKRAQISVAAPLTEPQSVSSGSFTGMESLPETLHKSPEFVEVGAPGGSRDEPVVTVGWLRFESAPPVSGSKTRKWIVNSREGWPGIGSIAWYAPWRRYVFAPELGAIFEDMCLPDLAAFVEARTEEQRATWKQRSPSQ